MSLIEHAKYELALINFGDEDSAIMVSILERFFDQWDSGGAVACVAPILQRLIAGQPLAPLTGADDEWFKPMDDVPMWQNVRCGSVFKDENGHCFDSDKPTPDPISFPYDPATKEVRPPVVEVQSREPR